MNILVVDDDPNIRQLVSIHLQQEGYKVLLADHAEHALEIIDGELIHLAIVDVMMPGMNGFQLTSILSKELSVPVILLTAKGQLEDKELGFLSGTEDYIVKPFEPKELLFRVAVVLRRYKPSLAEHLRIGNLSINRITYEVTIDQETIILPLKEFELLSHLVARAHQPVTRNLLMEYVWGEDYAGNEMTLNTHINRIRERLKRHHATVEIQTLRGIGYKLETLL
ncbi:response regulator transcription factor [Paenibacillus sp. 1P07SE]|uniref:response regulator transcription factor n=1 Tax=Paenibacillus sp. 1P07SE TaxID=3132209 RepID=UPI0039A66398